MRRPVRVLIADDESPARQRLATLLRDRDDVSLVASCVSGPTALASMEEARPELAFLDVQMPGFSGLEVVRRLADGARPVVVFVTAFDQYAIAAFEAHALDYLLKPYTDERFSESLRRAVSSVRGQAMLGLEPRLRALLSAWPSDVMTSDGHSETQRLAVRSGGSLQMVDVGEIRWISAERDHVILHGASVVRARSTLTGLLRQLDPSRFLQLSRSTIVQVAAVAELSRSSQGVDVVVLNDGTRVGVSRRFRTAVRRRLRVGSSLPD